MDSDKHVADLPSYLKPDARYTLSCIMETFNFHVMNIHIESLDGRGFRPQSKDKTRNSRPLLGNELFNVTFLAM